MKERKKYTVGECENPKYFISWGLGVQSTTLGVLSALGKIRKVDGIIFADPQWERKITYEVAEWYKNWFTNKGLSVFVVTAGNIRTDKKDHSDLPLWYGSSGAPIRRQCTSYYKIHPVRNKMREIMGLRADNKGRTRKNSAILYLGISTDEAQRMSDSNRSWIKNEFPLIDLGMSRQDCKDFLTGLGLPVPPKSACICCPYTDALRWLDLKNNSPEEFQQAVEFDKSIRRPPERMLSRGFTEDLFIFKGKEPLETANFEKHIKDNPLSDVCDSGYCFI